MSYSYIIDSPIVLCYNARLDPEVAQNYVRILKGQNLVLAFYITSFYYRSRFHPQNYGDET